MASAKTLSIAEIAIIKGMLNLDPQPTNQAILAHFTRPDRDLNHRLIAQIRDGYLHAAVSAASEAAVQTYMRVSRSRPHFDAAIFLSHPGGTTPAQNGARYLHLDWWPVGQGLFSTGAIVTENGRRFNWTYDCGTTSSDLLLMDAISSAHQQRWLLGLSAIDLAVLSHFDKDHISGFSRLVRSASIRVILLPYLTPLQRLVLALQQGLSADDGEFGFYVDPVGYLQGLDGGDIGEIIFVLPSGPDDSPTPPPMDPRPDPEGPEELPVKYQYDEPPEEADRELFEISASARVRYLKRGGTISVPFFWEFLPYNDASMLPKITKTFRSRASKLVQDMLNMPSARAKTLAKLKALYETVFRGSVDRNIISLFVYSGPLDPAATLKWLGSSQPVGLSGGSTRFAQMYTGDGSLGAGRQLLDFDNHYRPYGRLDRAGILQVMHHGAEGNWHAGLASFLNPAASIFSSDPNHKGYGHPHAAVLRDFWPFHSVQVDKEAGLHLLGVF
ncbi:hypothetical protein J2T09_003412 [Neorhizobium huautlense]|uniref:Metallo-beta-lactamase domain-containing protein n=1 Tax=Neorhizobium huautlense TaxID=67774 RepID=A0ABT9PWP1_9HYPH|nr:hypothetical protein [Neorhizobium huautlense]MDP9838640.1 hypothetical protein [Neorhizobium huautlense]